jgi:glycosyltransferase involved in cell wall biosynthesis
VECGPDKLNVVWIGSASIGWHDFDLLRESADRLWHSCGHAIAFHILGENFAGQRDLPPNVHYYGAELYEQLPYWLAGMDVGLILSRPGAADYSSPVKLFDYLACGLAVAGTRQPQVVDVLQPLDQADLLTPPGDAPALADALVRLAADRERVRRLGAAGRKLVERRYNWRRAVGETFEAIHTVQRERSRASRA